MKSNDFAAAPQLYDFSQAIERPQKHPSLARVAVVFCAAVLLMGFPDHNGHRELANMEGDSHTSIPPPKKSDQSPT